MNKRKFLIFITLIFTLFLSSCITPNEDVTVEFLDIYSLNDFHGAVEDINDAGMAKIGYYLKKQKSINKDNTIIISAGDMFQGTGLSSLTRGNVVVETMNDIGFDAMVIGNHEFDWGVNELVRFRDGAKDNGEADFPFLGANIYESQTNQRVEWVDPYTIIERGDLKIGIIGTIGAGLKSSILASIAEPYDFKNPLPIVKDLTRELRVDKGVDVVIVATHDADSNFNQELSRLRDEYYVDAVINGHTHSLYANLIERIELPPLPVIQSGDNGNYIGHIRLGIDYENKTVTDVKSGNINVRKELRGQDDNITKIINNFINNEGKTLYQELGVAGMNINRTAGTQWAVNMIQKYSGADVAFINNGGIRNAGFPIRLNQKITPNDIFTILPFDNKIDFVLVSVSQLETIMNNSGLTMSEVDEDFWTSHPDWNEPTILVATVDYVYEHNYYGFSQTILKERSDVIARDYLITGVVDSVTKNGKWLLD